MTPIFAACRKFDSSCGDSWSRYIKWSGYHHIHEVVSTDTMLCPSLIQNLIDEDWDFNIHADNRIYFFHDFEYLKRRIKYDASRHNILALFARPDDAPSVPDAFSMCGYDILDSDESISVLLNCGPFPSIFGSGDLNEYGLVTDLGRVVQIADNIRHVNSDDPHCCDCRVWGVARYTNAPNK